MSTERDVETPSGATQALSNAERQKQRQQRKARYAQILERGVVGDRLHVDLPPDVYGEWVTNDLQEIYRKQALGFVIDTEYAKKRALHTNGTDQAIVGDVIFMTLPREDKEILDEIRQEQFDRINGKPGDRRSLKEEREYTQQVLKEGGHLGVIAESDTRQVRKDELEAALGISK